MAKRKLKRGTNLDGVYYGPGESVDDEVFTNPKLFEDPEPGDADFDGELIDGVDDAEEVAEREAAARAAATAEADAGSKDPSSTTPAKKATAKKATTKKSASSSS